MNLAPARVFAAIVLNTIYETVNCLPVASLMTRKGPSTGLLNTSQTWLVMEKYRFTGKYNVSNKQNRTCKIPY
jgi:hypothetical protein